ncbi:hypothetical protein [Nocardia terpenica]|nr:hypothetical protein [Nocardia terpenica]
MLPTQDSGMLLAGISPDSGQKHAGTTVSYAGKTGESRWSDE